MPADLIILLLAVPLAAGVVTLLCTGRRWVQRGVGLTALAGNAGLALWGLGSVYRGAGVDGSILVSQMGHWPAPFGISLVLDPLAAVMIAVAAVVVLAVFIYAIEQLPGQLEGGMFHPLYHLLNLGVVWSFLTGDLFNLFVGFEIMLMASYAMLVIGTTRAQMRNAYKYVLLNLFSSLMLVTCCGLIYGQVGTLNMAHLAQIAQAGELPANSVPVFALLLVVFGLKTAIFPLWFWLPDTYHTMPATMGALFGGLLTKVGAYTLIRTFVMILGSPEAGVAEVVKPIILISAGVTMFVGVLGAVSMHTVRRILSIHIISQVGYMILGIGLGMGLVAGLSGEERLTTQEIAVAGAIFFIIHNMVVKCCLFLCGGLMQQHAGSDDLDSIGGLLRRAPWLAALFLIAALSLAGLPPLSGFFGKWMLIHESFVQEQYVLVGLAIATSLLTLLSMLKIWSYGFWSPARGRHVEEPARRPEMGLGMAGVAILVVVALSMGLGAQQYYNVSRSAARTLVNPQAYVDAVLISATAPGALPPVEPVAEASAVSMEAGR
jgi:multicomponent Na+:H+ antiporter subunit D